MRFLMIFKKILLIQKVIWEISEIFVNIKTIQSLHYCLYIELIRFQRLR